MSFTIEKLTEEQRAEITEEQIVAKQEEVKKYLLCVKGNASRMEALTSFGIKYEFEGSSRQISQLPQFRQERIEKTVGKGIKNILSGKVEFKVGKGTVWYDYESVSNALTVRVAYYKIGKIGNRYLLTFDLSERQEVKCEGCDDVSKWFKKCSKCEQAHYCSPECQKKHWSEHKKVCGA